MKRITAIIKPFKIDEAKRALTQVGVSGITVSEVRGFGRQKGHMEIYRGAEYSVDLLPKIKLETIVSDGAAEKVVEALLAACRTGQVGDGKLLVDDVVEAVRVRTGDAGEAAL